mmetsp:Transcript_23733/g.58989  ORF Transcript_23733/g.58989 Transcript_23733/m.58989 type:complete len:453 (+) Transcript_23733:51-1409(+)
MPLIIVGTYGEKLGHVDGKGKGLYVMKFDAENKGFMPSSGFIGAPQLGGLKNPSYLTSYRDEASGALQIYIVDESSDGPGTVSAATVDEETGELKALGPAVPADADLGSGAACSHVSVAPGGKHVFAANFLGASIVAIARNPETGALDESKVQYLRFPPPSHPIQYPLTNAERQEQSHAHQVLVSAGTKTTSILVPDLGSDVVWSVPYDGANTAAPLGEPAATASHPALAGGGPRHAALHPTEAIAYVAYELSTVVACFAVDKETGAIVGAPLGVINALGGFGYEGGAGAASGAFLTGGGGGVPSYEALVEANGVSGAAPDLPRGHGLTRCSDKKAAIGAVRVTPDASHVVVSNRIFGAPGALSAIPLTRAGLFEEQSNAPVMISSTLGHTPRDFVVLPPVGAGGGGGRAGGFIAMVANQDTDEIVVMGEGEAPRVLTKEVPTPVCLCVLPE